MPFIHRRSRICISILFFVILYFVATISTDSQPEPVFESFSQQPMVEIFKDKVVFTGCGPDCVVELQIEKPNKYKKARYEKEIPKNYPYQIPLGTQLAPSEGSFRSPRDIIKNEDKKYFYEDDQYHHLDHRYSIGNKSEETKFENIHQVFKHWALFADSIEMPYWIMHGTLLGWHWGGKTMPFDDDIDIQVLSNNLYDLEKYHRQIIAGHFLLEVNPNHVVRRKQERNIIDARFIDTTTGHFIDITGVSKFDGIDYVMCKTPHFYREQDIFPLFRTTHEGIPTWRPNRYKMLLSQEYENRPYFNVIIANIGMAIRSE
ncbi:hypothetical protein HK103_006262 [Boothiomyces macroporosus]|uniref:LicD/FKTN/FKRP nucleotidyltransferase domain-containing protein n=1 Tax=Boothiomyces macroporosus TaxID=261099 RepID=A0AAD5UHZ3_9FUNG|nr:hypothetical protein HK103_006262 [Boothiomyces macroporosus]